MILATVVKATENT